MTEQELADKLLNGELVIADQRFGEVSGYLQLRLKAKPKELTRGEEAAEREILWPEGGEHLHFGEPNVDEDCVGVAVVAHLMDGVRLGWVRRKIARVIDVERADAARQAAAEMRSRCAQVAHEQSTGYRAGDAIRALPLPGEAGKEQQTP